jgi:hypothetical protein
VYPVIPRKDSWVNELLLMMLVFNPLWIAKAMSKREEIVYLIVTKVSGWISNWFNTTFTRIYDDDQRNVTNKATRIP